MKNPPKPVLVFVHYIVRNYMFKNDIVYINFTVRDIVTLDYSQLRSDIRGWVGRYASPLDYFPKARTKKLWA